MRERCVRKSISEICDKASSNIAQNKIADIDGDYPVYGASGYIQNVDFYHRDTEYIGIVKDGSGVGRVNVYPAYSSLLGTMQYIIPKEGYLLGYVAYALKGLNLSSFASGAAIPHIYFKDYGKCKIDIPPLSEQQRIVSELDLLSSIIEKKKEQLKEYDQLAQSIFFDMFGDPVANEKGWEVKKLGECCKNCDSQRKPITAKNRIKGFIPYYGASGIVDYVKDFIFDGEYLLVSEDGANLLMRSTPIAFRIKGKTWVNNHAHVLQFDAVFKQIFVEYSINLRDISSIVTGCAQPKLTQAAMNNLNITYPPLSLQQSFAEKIEAIERQKALIQQSITETETLFNSRMDYYFN